LIMTTWH